MTALTLCVILWAHPGHEDDLVRYEDQVLALLPDHGAKVLKRTRTAGGRHEPLEVHLLEFPSQAALDAYLADDRRTALADVRDEAIAKTEVLPVTVV